MTYSNIIPCLWFDHQAEEAVKFYTTVFKTGEIKHIIRYPKDNVLTVKFQLAGQDFVALNGGPEFTFTPATSFFVGCETSNEFDKLWRELSNGGSILMEAEPMLPFFEKFGWLQDKYGLSWQLGICRVPQYITPYLLFVGKQHGRAEEAITFYRSVFDISSCESIMYYGQEEGESEGTLQHASFSINGQSFMAADSGLEHPFSFTEAVSFYVYCQTQEEIDRYWEPLSNGGEKGVCGWLKDKFGISWQIVPATLEKMMADADTEKIQRLAEALWKMKKLDMKALQKAYDDQ